MLLEKYKPKSLYDIKNQDNCVSYLKNTLKNNNLNQIVFFLGASGTGKSSTAKVLAAILNCENPIINREGVPNPCGKCADCKDIFESKYRRDVRFLDGSDLGIDKMKDLDNYCSTMAFTGKNKIIIFDEAQNISGVGKQKFLTMMEKLPPKTYFFICTMNPESFDISVKSRGTQLNFFKPKLQKMNEFIISIIKKENLFSNLSNELLIDTINIIAETAYGSFRKAVTVLDKLANTEFNDINDVIEVLGEFPLSKVKLKIEELLNRKISFFNNLDFRDKEIFNTFFFRCWNELNDNLKSAINNKNRIDLIKYKTLVKLFAEVFSKSAYYDINKKYFESLILFHILGE